MCCKFCNIIISVYIVTTLSLSQYIEEPLDEMDNMLKLKINFDKDLVFTRFPLDLSKPFASIPFSYLPEESRKYCYNQQITIDVSPTFIVTNPSIIQGTLTLTKSKHIINNFAFLSSSVLNKHFIGLGYNVKHTNMSLPYSICNSNSISQPIYGFRKDEITKEYLMYFGQIPQQFVSKYTKQTITINDSKGDWGLNIKSISYDSENTFEYVLNNEYAYVNTVNDRIFIPQHYIDYLKETVFDDYVKNRKCSFNKDLKSYYINCDCPNGINDMKGFPNMNIKIDKYILTLNLENLFIYIKSQRLCLFIMQYNYNEPTVWFFGYYFIKAFITEFDIENKTISFYTQSNSIINSNEGVSDIINIQKRISIMISVILLITMGIIMFVKVKLT